MDKIRETYASIWQGHIMQFLVTAHDGTDPGAAQRRAEAKEAHRELGYEMIRSRQILFSTGIIDDDENPTGSLRVMEFESRAALDAWLEIEPYVKHNVWQDIVVERCKMGPAFEWVTLEANDIKLTPSEDG